MSASFRGLFEGLKNLMCCTDNWLFGLLCCVEWLQQVVLCVASWWKIKMLPLFLCTEQTCDKAYLYYFVVLRHLTKVNFRKIT